MAMAVDREFDRLLLDAQRGDESSFTELYRQLNPLLVTYFSGHAPKFADDLASETWIAVARNLSRFGGDERGFRAWVFTIARRRLVEHWRAQARTPVTTEADLLLDGFASDDDTEWDGLADLSAADAVAAVRAVLSSSQADVVLLRCLADLDVDQVAGITGKTPGAVRVLQHRALRRLADAYRSEVLTS